MMKMEMRKATETGMARSRRFRATAALMIASSLAVVSLAACGAATEPQAPSVSTPEEIVSLMDTPRLTSLSSRGGVVTAEGQAARDAGDDLRTYWFTTVGALAHVQEFGGSSIVRKVLHGTTALEEFSGEESLGTLRDPATFLSEEELKAHVLRWADAAGVVVEEVNYVPLLGGTAEVVLRPKDELAFMRDVDLRMYRFFSGLPPEERPFLVTFVDSSGANRRVEGGFSLGDDKHVRLSDGTKAIVGGSEGFGWQADDLTEELGVDVSGRPIGPVAEAPEPAPLNLSDLSSTYEKLCRGLGVERAAESFGSAPTAEDAAKAVAEVEPKGPRRDAIYEGCLQGFRQRR